MMFEKHFLNKPAAGKEDPDTLMAEKFEEARLKSGEKKKKKSKKRIKEIDMGLKPIEEEISNAGPEESGAEETKTEERESGSESEKHSESMSEIPAEELKKGLEARKKEQLREKSSSDVRRGPKGEKEPSNLERIRGELELAKKRGDKKIAEYYENLLEKTEFKKPERKTGPKQGKRRAGSVESAAKLAESRPFYVPDDAQEEKAKIKNIKAMEKAEEFKTAAPEKKEEEEEAKPASVIRKEAEMIGEMVEKMKTPEKEKTALKPENASPEEKPREKEELTWEEILQKSRLKEEKEKSDKILRIEDQRLREKEGARTEKEKSPAEVLEESREKLARKYAELKEKKLGLFGSARVDDPEQARETAALENEYRNALKIYRKLRLDENPNEYKKILLDTVVGEAEKLDDLKLAFRYEEKKDGRFEKIKKMAGGAVERYRKIPTRYKLLLSAGLFATGVGAGYLGGAAGWALATGVVSGRWFQRMFGGAAAAVGLEAGMRVSQEKAEKKEVLKKFEKEVLFLSEQKSVELDKRLFELEGGKKWNRAKRGALAGTVGVLIMSGLAGRAIKGAFGFAEHTNLGRKIESILGGAEKGAPEVKSESFFEKVKGWLRFGGEPNAAETAGAENIPPESAHAPSGEAPAVQTPETPTVAPEAPTSANVEIPETMKVVKGDSLWKISQRYLEGKGALEGLSPEQKIYAIDALKDKLAEGMNNPNALQSGQEIGFGDKFTPEDIGKFVEDAKGLSPEQIENIASYRGEAIAPGAPTEITREAITKNLFENLGVGSKLYDEFAGQNLKNIVNLSPSDFAVRSGGEFWEDWSFGDENKFWKIQKAIKEVYDSLPASEKALADKMSTGGFMEHYWPMPGGETNVIETASGAMEMPSASDVEGGGSHQTVGAERAEIPQTEAGGEIEKIKMAYPENIRKLGNLFMERGATEESLRKISEGPAIGGRWLEYTTDKGRTFRVMGGIEAKKAAEYASKMLESKK